MSVASLLNPQSPFFPFDHDQYHRTMMFNLPAGSGAQATPYLLDPVFAADIPAGWWNFNHGQAHDDFAHAFSAIYWPSTVSLTDINLETGPNEWWALSNQKLHDLAASKLPSH